MHGLLETTNVPIRSQSKLHFNKRFQRTRSRRTLLSYGHLMHTAHCTLRHRRMSLSLDSPYKSRSSSSPFDGRTPPRFHDDFTLSSPTKSFLDDYNFDLLSPPKTPVTAWGALSSNEQSPASAVPTVGTSRALNDTVPRHSTSTARKSLKKSFESTFYTPPKSNKKRDQREALDEPEEEGRVTKVWFA